MNNIKTYKLLVWGLACCATLAGCSDDFLDTHSKTNLDTDNAYQTEAQAEYAVIGCYDGYQRTVSNGNFPSLFQAAETMSDDCLGGGSSNDRTNRLMDRFDMSIKSDATSLFESLWTDYYAGIYRCNQLLSSLDGITWTSDETRNVVECETRALRGIEYFDLVRMFERVPLLTVPTKEIVAQDEPDKVYEQIVEDLKFAADNMPADQYRGNTNNLGRVTKYAAEAMLARVYLFYDGVYGNNAGADMPGGLTKAQALQYCEDVIASGNYKLEANFADLWPGSSTKKSSPSEGKITTYKEASDEIIFVMKFNNDQNWSNSQYNGNRFIINLGLSGVWADFAPYGLGWGACPMVPYLKNKLFDAADKRGEATLIDCRAIGAYDVQIANDIMDYTGYVNKKYCPLVYSDGSSIPASEATVASANFMTSQDQNWVIMRYADVLLMAAELGSPNATRYYNEVRERAFGDNDHNIANTPTREQIWEERHREFVGEGVRYFDLRRQGLDAFVKAEMGQATEDGTENGQPVKVYNNKVEETVESSFVENNIRSKRGFWQIPYNQITLSGNTYKQNAGW